jgi:hypothetical protein
MSKRKITNKSKIKYKPKMSLFSKHMSTLVDSADLGKFHIIVVLEDDELEAAFEGRDKPPVALREAVKFWIDSCREAMPLQNYLNMMFNAKDFTD